MKKRKYYEHIRPHQGGRCFRVQGGIDAGGYCRNHPRKKITILVEKNAGEKAGFFDRDYEEASAVIVDTRTRLVEQSDYVVAINGAHLLAKDNLKNKVVIGLFDPYFNRALIKEACALQATLISLELIPRISRAQSMDLLS